MMRFCKHLRCCACALLVDLYIFCIDIKIPIKKCSGGGGGGLPAKELGVVQHLLPTRSGHCRCQRLLPCLHPVHWCTSACAGVAKTLCLLSCLHYVELCTATTISASCPACTRYMGVPQPVWNSCCSPISDGVFLACPIVGGVASN